MWTKIRNFSLRFNSSKYIMLDKSSYRGNSLALFGCRNETSIDNLCCIKTFLCNWKSRHPWSYRIAYFAYEVVCLIPKERRTWRLHVVSTGHLITLLFSQLLYASWVNQRNIQSKMSIHPNKAFVTVGDSANALVLVIRKLFILYILRSYNRMLDLYNQWILP